MHAQAFLCSLALALCNGAVTPVCRGAVFCPQKEQTPGLRVLICSPLLSLSAFFSTVSLPPLPFLACPFLPRLLLLPPCYTARSFLPSHTARSFLPSHTASP
eukprot:1922493-Pleurochrysis_carterae.AAC.1